MGAAMRYQPQGRARLDRSNPLVAGAQAIISAAHPANLVSQRTLVSSGALSRAFSPVGKTIQFRKSFYAETESLPVIGTQSFVEFWYGYPSSDQGNQGNGAVDPTFLTGSSANNIAIVASIGATRGSSNWGALYNWGNGAATQFNNAGEVLTPGVLALLVVVRRQTGMEFWHNGRLVASVSQTPANIVATTMIAGAFVEAAFWTSSSDMAMTGRILGEWSPDQVRAFSANPWQIFTSGSSSSAYQAVIASASASSGGGAATNTAVSPASGALGITGYAPTVVRGASVAIGPAPGGLSIAGYAPAVTQGTTTSVVPGVGTLSITGYAPSITQSINTSIVPGSAGLALTGYAPTVARTANQSQTPQPGALTITGYAPTVVRSFNQSIVVPASAGSVTMLALTGYAPSISQGLNVVPQYYDATIMQLSAVRSTANLGPDRIQQTVDLV